jgi:hypothetical protein
MQKFCLLLQWFFISEMPVVHRLMVGRLVTRRSAYRALRVLRAWEPQQLLASVQHPPASTSGLGTGCELGVSRVFCKFVGGGGVCAVGEDILYKIVRRE